jgi:hypothetical protein
MNKETAMRLLNAISRVEDELYIIKNTIKIEMDAPVKNTATIPRNTDKPATLASFFEETQKGDAIGARYDKINGILEIDASEEQFNPKYLQYMLEAMELPKNTEIRFLK